MAKPNVESWTLPYTPTEVMVGGERCWVLTDFMLAVQRSRKALYGLMKFGNQLGKLRVHRLGISIFVPVEELTQFVFVSSGRYGKMHAYTHAYDPGTRRVTRKYQNIPLKRSGVEKEEA